MSAEAPSTHRHYAGFGSQLRAVAIVAALSCLALSGSTAAHAESASDPGSIGVRLIDVPSAAQNDPRARQYVVDHLEPGATIERRFEISNTSGADETVEVYAAAAAITDGTFLGEEGRGSNPLSQATTFSDDVVVVPAGSTVVDTVTVAIPADAEPGETYAAIWAEARSDGAGPVEIVNRVGIRMYISIGGDNAAATDFSVDSLTASRDSLGAATVTAIVHNSGGRAIDATAMLTLKSTEAAVTAGPYPSTSSVSIAPGDEAPIVVEIPDATDAGPWTARLEVTSGTIVRQFEAPLTFPAAGEYTSAAHSAGDFPWAVTGIVAALLALAALATALLVRRRKNGAAHVSSNDAHV